MAAELGRSPNNPATTETAGLLLATNLIRAYLRDDPESLATTATELVYTSPLDLVIRVNTSLAIIAASALHAKCADTATALEILGRLDDRAKFRQVLGAEYGFADPT